jgi:hypothetical protein
MKGWLGRLDPKCDWVFPNEGLDGPWIGGPLYVGFHGAAKGAGIARKITLEDVQRFGAIPENRRALAAALPDMKPPESKPAEMPGKVRSRRSESSEWGIGPDAPAITIRRSDRMAFVFGEQKGRLSITQARVINVLLRAGPQGLTLAQMEAKLTTKSGRKILVRLKEIDDDWGAAILFAGRSHAGYRIASAGNNRV